MPSLRVMTSALAAAALMAAGAGWWWLRGEDGTTGAAGIPVPADTRHIDPDVMQAIQAAVDAARQRPRDAQSFLVLGKVYDAHVLPELACQAFAQAVALEDGDAVAWYHLARNRAETGDLEAALLAVDRSISLKGDYSPAHWRRGLWLMDLQRLDEAEASFRRAAELDRKDPGGPMGLTRVALQRGDAQSGALALEPFVRQYGNHAASLRLLATAYQQLGRADEAAALQARARSAVEVVHDPWKSELDQYRVGYTAVIRRAQMLLQQRRPADAIAMLEWLWVRRGPDPALMLTLAAAHAGTSQIDRAEALVRNALAHWPDDYAVQYNVALTAAKKHDYRRALAHSSKAIELNPTFGPAHLMLGELFIKAQNFEAAVEPLQQALRYGAVDRAVALDRLGWVHYSLGRPREGLAAFREIARDNPRHAAAHVGIGGCLAELGQLNEAVAELNRAIELDARVVDDKNFLNVRQRIELRRRLPVR